MLARDFLCVFSFAAVLLSCREQSPKPPAVSSSSDAVGSSCNPDAVSNSSSSSCIGGVSGNILTDSRDCKQYKIIVFGPLPLWPPDAGPQTWMAENLNYAGDDGNSGVCYGSDPFYCGLYGRLYYWGQAMHACPPGWRLPYIYDWARLSDYVYKSTNGEKEAEHLKAREGWADCGPPGSGRRRKCLDTFGFAALPGGFAVYSDGDLDFRDAGHKALWWSANRDKRKGYAAAFVTFLSNDRYLWAGVPRGVTSNTKNDMLSVRCIKKEEIP